MNAKTAMVKAQNARTMSANARATRTLVTWLTLARGTRVVDVGYPGAMAMTIKNERVLDKIRDLAQTLETDQVSAVEQAVDAMSKAAAQSVLEQRLDEVLELASVVRRGLPRDWDAEDLYDDAGLPR